MSRNKGFNVQLCFEDGMLDGVISIDCSGWSGKAISVPRNEVKTLENRYKNNQNEHSIITGPGLYFLFCDGDESTGFKKSIYVGETHNTAQRLNQHIKDYETIDENGNRKEKFHWNYAICFAAFDLSNETIRLYLENLYRYEIKDGGYYVCLTKASSKKALSTPDKTSAKQIKGRIDFLLPILNIELFKHEDNKTDGELVFTCTARKSNANGYRTARDNFTVMKGSIIANTTTKSFNNDNMKTSRDRRQSLIESGVIVDNKFTKDYTFKSANEAACVILGSNVRGNETWSYNGKTLREIQLEEAQ